jgi:hypothetical protein
VSTFWSATARAGGRTAGRRARYRFRHAWTVPGTRPEAVYDVLADVAGYPSWWRSVRAVGRLADDEALVACRSRLPKTLHLVLRPRVQDREGGVLEASLDGELVGWSRFALAPRTAPGGGEAGVAVCYQQEVETPGRVLDWAGRVARPLLVWNHAQMMRTLQADLAERLGVSASGRRTPGPPA